MRSKRSCHSRKADHWRPTVGIEPRPACAQQKGLAPGKNDQGLASLLSGLLEASFQGRETQEKAACEQCGTKFSELRKGGKFGCEECFSAFRRDLRVLLQNTTGHKKHRGKYPARLKNVKSYLVDRAALKAQLKEAVKREDYEKAAQLRDRLKAFEEEPRRSL